MAKNMSFLEQERLRIAREQLAQQMAAQQPNGPMTTQQKNQQAKNNAYMDALKAYIGTATYPASGQDPLVGDVFAYAAKGKTERNQLANSLMTGAGVKPKRGDVKSWDANAAKKAVIANESYMQALRNIGMYDTRENATNAQMVSMVSGNYLNDMLAAINEDLNASMTADRKSSDWMRWYDMLVRMNELDETNEQAYWAYADYLLGDQAEPWDYDRYSRTWGAMGDADYQQEMDRLRTQFEGLDLPALAKKNGEYKSMTSAYQEQLATVQREMERRAKITALEQMAKSNPQYDALSVYEYGGVVPERLASGDSTEEEAKAAGEYLRALQNQQFFVNVRASDEIEDFYSGYAGRDVTAWRGSGYGYLTPDEIAVYNVLYNTDKHAAEDYLQALQSDLFRRMADVQAMEDAVFAQNGAFAFPTWMESVAAGLVTPFAALAQGVSAATGTDDPNSPLFYFNRKQQNIRSAQEEVLGELDAPEIMGKNLYQWGYGGVSSAADNAARLMFGPQGSLAAAGLQSASSSLYENAGREDMSGAAKITQALLTGGLEVGTEKIGLDALFDMGQESALKYLVKAIGSELGEESVNYFGEYGVELAVAWLFGHEAEIRSAEELAMGYGETVLNTLISSGVMSGPGAAMTGSNTRNQGKATRTQGNVDALMNIGMSMPETSKTGAIARELDAKKKKKGKTYSNYDLGRLTMAIEEETSAELAEAPNKVMDEAIEERLVELGETKENAKALAPVVRQTSRGQKSTSKQRAAMKWTDNAEQVVKELTRETAAEDADRVGNAWVGELKGKTFGATAEGGAKLRTVYEATGKVKKQEAKPQQTKTDENVSKGASLAKAGEGKFTGKAKPRAVIYEDAGSESEGTVTRFHKTGGEMVAVVETTDADGKTTTKNVALDDIKGTSDAGIGAVVAHIEDADQRGHNMSEQQASTMLHVYEQEGGDAKTFIDGFEDAYFAGYIGADISPVGISEGAAKIAYEQGKAEAATDESNRVARASRVRADSKGEVSFIGKVKSSAEVTGKGDAKALPAAFGKMTESQQTTVRIVQAFAQKFKTNIVLFESDANNIENIENGAYDPNTNTIYLDINSGANTAYQVKSGKQNTLGYAMVRTLGHELTHHLESTSPTAYAAYKNAVKAALKENGKDWASLVRGKMDSARMAGHKLTYAGAEAEVVADASEYVLQNSKFVNEIDTETQGKVKKFIKNFMRKLGEVFQHVTGGHSESKAIRETVDGVTRYMGNIQNLWDAAMDESIGRTGIQDNQSVEATETVEDAVMEAETDEVSDAVTEAETEKTSDAVEEADVEEASDTAEDSDTEEVALPEEVAAEEVYDEPAGVSEERTLQDVIVNPTAQEIQQETKATAKRADPELIEGLKERFGLNVQVADTRTQLLAAYNKADDTILIGKNASTGEVLYKALAMEMFRSVEGTKYATDLRNALWHAAYQGGFAAYAADTSAVADMLNRKFDNYGNRKLNAESTLVQREMNARMAAQVLGNADSLNSLLETERPTLLRKIRNALRNFVNKLRGIKSPAMTPLQRAEQMMAEALDERLRAKALDERARTKGKRAKIPANFGMQSRQDITAAVTMMGEEVALGMDETAGDVQYSSREGASEAINIASNMETTDGKRMFSLRSFTEDYDTYRDMLLNHGSNEEEVDALFHVIDEVMKDVEANREILDFGWNVGRNDRSFSPIKPNSDSLYVVSMDFSTLCRKRLLQQTVQERLETMYDTVLTKAERVAIRNELMKLREEGKQIEVACALCYVESVRLKSPAQIQRFFNDQRAVMVDYFAKKNKAYMDQVKAKADELIVKFGYESGTPKNSLKTKFQRDSVTNLKQSMYKQYKPTAEEEAIIATALSLPGESYKTDTGLWNLKKEHEAIFDAYTSFVRNATKSKGIEGDEAWWAGDSKSISDKLIEKMNKENGLRTQSWSDFQVRHLLDYIAAIIELSTRGAKMQSYTKVPDFVNLMGHTGVMINLSLIPKGFDGTLNYDPIEGMPIETALALREMFPNTVGTICIGITKEHIVMLLADPNTDYVIPYHSSSLDAKTRQKMGMKVWQDFQQYQSEKNKDYPNTDSESDKYHKKPLFSEWFDYKTVSGMANELATEAIAKLKNPTESQKVEARRRAAEQAMKEAADRYKELCHQRGLQEKFEQFSGDPNYWKLLIDRKMINQKTGEIIKQEAVKPRFDLGRIRAILSAEVNRFKDQNEDFNEAVAHIERRWADGDIRKAAKSKKVKDAVSAFEDTVTVANIVESAKELDNVQRSLRDQTETEAFKHWFGNSKVVNADGTPKVVYHQTGAKFTVFNTDNPLAGLNDSETPNGMFFKDNDHDIGLGGQYQMAVYLKADNILHFANRREANDWYQKNVPGYADVQKKLDRALAEFEPRFKAIEDEQFDPNTSDERVDELFEIEENLIKELGKVETKYRSQLRELLNNHFLHGGSGYDAIELDYDGHRWVNGVRENVHTYIVFSPTQIKSATDNVGTFDPGNPDIRFSLRDTPEEISTREFLTDADSSIAETVEERNALSIYQKLLKNHAAASEAVMAAEDALERAAEADKPEARKALTAARAKQKDLYNRLLNVERTAHVQTVVKRSQQIINDLYGKNQAEVDNMVSALERKVESLKADLQGLKGAAKTQQEADIRAAERNLAAYKSKAAKALLDSNEKYAKRIADLRERVELNAEVSRKQRHIKRVVEKLDNLIRREDDYKNVKEHLKPAVHNLVSAFIDDFGGLVFDSKKAKTLKSVYDVLKQDDETSEYYDEEVSDWLTTLAELARQDEERRTSGSTLENLNDKLYIYTTLSDIVDHVAHMVTAADTMFIEGKKAEVSAVTEEVGDILSAKKDRRELSGVLGEAARFADNLIVKGNMIPQFFFEGLNNDGMMRLYDGLQDGVREYSERMLIGDEFLSDVMRRHGYHAWDGMKKPVAFKTQQGDTIYLTRENMMWIYATAKREASNPIMDTHHLDEGGITYEKIPHKNGRAIEGKGVHHLIVAEDVNKITQMLTADQIAYVDECVEFLSSECADWGNEASMRLFGIKKYKEKYYFPFKVDSDQLHKNSAAGATSTVSDARVKHISFSHSIKKGANLPLIMGDFTSVISDHINQMATYSGMVVPIENMSRVLNRKVYDGRENVNIRSLIARKHGDNTARYIDDLLKDLNGGPQVDNRGSLDAGLRLFKRNAVVGKLSVAVQQPTAITRAFAYINPRWFANLRLERPKHTWERMMKYSSTAFLKDMGGFNVGMGKGAAKWLERGDLGDYNVYKRAKFLLDQKSFKDAVGEWNDFLTGLPGFMDKITWCAIWNAAENEQAHQHPSMDRNSDAFLEMVGRRFDGIINHTQVYDSILSKSQNMRSKNPVAKMTTSFMAESTLNMNLAYRAFASKDGKQIAKVTSSLILNAVLGAAAYALIGAFNKDDDDRTWEEKYATAFAGRLADNLSPIASIPYLSYLWDTLQGYDVKRTDMSFLLDLIDAGGKFWSNMTDPEKELSYRDYENFVGGLISTATGFPAKNWMGDARRIWNMMHTSTENAPASRVKYGILDEVVLGRDTSNKAYYDRYLAALKDGDTQEQYDLKDYLMATKKVKEESFVEGVRNAYKAEYQRGSIEKQTAVNFLVDNGLAKDRKNAFEYVDRWEEGGENHSAYKSIREDIWRSDFAAVTEGIRELEANGWTPQQVYNALHEDVDEQYMLGSMTQAQYKAWYNSHGVAAGKPQRDDNDWYWEFKRLDWGKAHGGSDEGYNAYDDLYKAVEAGGSGLSKTIKEYQKYGKTREDLNGKLNSYFKPLLIEAKKSGRGFADLQAKVLTAYQLLGYDRQQKLKTIQGWLTEAN